MRALVVGGTGPTGHFMVNGLRDRGFQVTILHSGNHEVPEIPDDVEHVHSDAFSPERLAVALGRRTFDLCIATYGRLRAIAALMERRVGRFLSVGGAPAYRGFMNPGLLTPAGLPVPIRENAAKVADPAEDEKGWRILNTEEVVFDHHPGATHFRYPLVYGPYQPMPREWSIVRRVRDGRRQLVLPDGGLTLQHCGYAGNLAHAVLLAVDQPQAAAGEIYQCGDEEVPTLRQVVEIVAASLGASLEIVSLPWKLAVPARPLIALPFTTHRVFDIGKLRHDLGYRDVVPPGEALALTARWLDAHPPEPGGMEEKVLQDPFDYATEDRLIEAWQEALAGLPEVSFREEPGYTLSYSGPGGRPRSKPEFE